MCGIFGVVFGDSPLHDKKRGMELIERLFLLSESRGKEAAGLAVADPNALTIFKTPTNAARMLKMDGYKRITKSALSSTSNGHYAPLVFIGHSRLVTDGVRDIHDNNQPVHYRGVVGVHNGIVVNDESLWQHNPDLERRSELDSEVIFALMRKNLAAGKSIRAAAAATFDDIEGATSIAALFEDADKLLLATNNGSLYYQRGNGLFVFASESYLLRVLDSEFDVLEGTPIVHVKPGMATIVDTTTLAADDFSLASPDGNERPHRPRPRSVEDRSPSTSSPHRSVAYRRVDPVRLLERFPYVSMRNRLKRCTRCVLPETMPFVDFDDNGVCSYCRHYPPIEVHGREALEQVVAPYRRRDGSPDCIVGVSGGRDSIYGLHYLKKELGMNPVAYTYDWGMVTDLARRNVARICGKLGIEHILVSADIPRKREFIRQNVEAWLARPSLGTIPLFMAGDKAYFHYLNQTKGQVGVELSFLCENLFERTDFKTGFAGVAPFHDPDHVYTLPIQNKIGLLRYYSREFISNPKYFNASLLDTAKAFAFYYLIRRRYHNLYRYVMWDEDVIESVLLGEYGFELAEDTQSTWRIGDGTAAFYNYIYYAIAGMTENDTFRSNQIRNGAITRDKALERIDRDNRPRFQSIQWYLDTIGIDRSIEEVLETINSAPKLYRA